MVLQNKDEVWYQEPQKEEEEDDEEEKVEEDPRVGELVVGQEPAPQEVRDDAVAVDLVPILEEGVY